MRRVESTRDVCICAACVKHADGSETYFSLLITTILNNNSNNNNNIMDHGRKKPEYNDHFFSSVIISFDQRNCD